VAALASWLDARAHGGQWLVRIEDVDTPRCVPGTDAFILGQLAACGLVPDEAPVWQSRRGAFYQAALDKLALSGRAYPCGCSRKDIEDTLEALGRPRERHAELVYPGICRTGLHGKPVRAWRFLTAVSLPNSRSVHAGRAQDAIENIATSVQWSDRRLGPQQQDVAREVGDFVLKRADGLWAYQLAVVLDDAAQGVSHVVRGEDLADNTARQILLQRALELPTPRYLHTPLVLGENGEKLSKQNGAQAIDTDEPLAALRAAGALLGLQPQADDVPGWLAQACMAWRAAYGAEARGGPAEPGR